MAELQMAERPILKKRDKVMSEQPNKNLSGQPIEGEQLKEEEEFDDTDYA